MKLWHSYLKELKLSSKGFYFYIEILMTIIILVVILFVIPEDMTSIKKEYLYFDLEEPYLSYYLDAIIEEDYDKMAKNFEMEIDDKVIRSQQYEIDDKEVFIFSNEQDMIDAAEAKRPLVGAKISWDMTHNNYKYDYYIQGYESDRLRNLYLIIHSKNLEALVEKADDLEVVALETGHEQLNTRQMSIPSLITFNGSLMGMFIMAAYIFLDKQEGIIKAYAVTASSVWVYLLSKALTLMTVTFATTMVIVVPVMGNQPAYLPMIILLLTSAFFSSSLGLLLASYFDDLTQAFGAIYAVMMVFMLPAIGYFIPSWDPLWMKLIPIHYLIQGFKETILINGDVMYVMYAALGFLVAGVGIFLLANHQFKKSLTV